MKVVKLDPSVKTPVRGTPFSAAIDLFMPKSGLVTHKPKMFELGIAVEIPQGFVGLLVPRSSTGAKDGLCITNTIGVIDSDYRGELKAMLHIQKDYPLLQFHEEDRLVQLCIVPIYVGDVQLVDSLTDTKRGAGGFGSTSK